MEEVERGLSRNRLVRCSCTVRRKHRLFVFNLVAPRSLSLAIVPPVSRTTENEHPRTSEYEQLQARSTSNFLANESRCSEIDLTYRDVP